MKQLIWLAYDLGLQGDYQGLYTWLDAHQANECGDSLAALTYEHEGDLCAALKRDLQAAFDVNNKTQFYVKKILQESPYDRSSITAFYKSYGGP